MDTQLHPWLVAAGSEGEDRGTWLSDSTGSCGTARVEAHSCSGWNFGGSCGLTGDTVGTTFGRKMDADGSVASKDGRDRELIMASNIRNADVTRSPDSDE